MSATGVEEMMGLGLPALRAISCSQLTFELQRECYSIPVLQVSASAWQLDLMPALGMPGHTKGIVRLPAKDS